MTTFFKASRKK